METPPPLPAPKQPLGPRFYLLLLTPLALMALSFCCFKASDFAGPLLSVTGAATLVCSIILGMQLGRRMSKPGASSAGMSFVMFLAVQAFYAACFFVGCTATLALS
jgi:hypothetical protein